MGQIKLISGPIGLCIVDARSHGREFDSTYSRGKAMCLTPTQAGHAWSNCGRSQVVEGMKEALLKMKEGDKPGPQPALSVQNQSNAEAKVGALLACEAGLRRRGHAWRPG